MASITLSALVVIGLLVTAAMSLPRPATVEGIHTVTAPLIDVALLVHHCVFPADDDLAQLEQSRAVAMTPPDYNEETTLQQDYRKFIFSSV